MNHKDYISEADLRRAKKQFDKDYRHFAWDVWVHMKMHPELLELKKNQEIYKHIQEIQLKYWGRKHQDRSDKDILDFLELWTDIIANDKNTVDYHFDQADIDMLHPDFQSAPEVRAILVITVLMHVFKVEMMKHKTHLPEQRGNAGVCHE